MAVTSITPDTRGTASGDKEGFSQATVRTYRIFTDQHGREWGADCEKSTNHPCAPLSPRFRAPMYPDAKYIVITDTVRGVITIDYMRWIRDLRDAHMAYEQEVYRVAVNFYAEKAADAVEKMPPALYKAVGPAPKPIEPVQSCAAGNAWMLGTPGAEKPAAAERFFPTPKVPELRTTGGITMEAVDDPFSDGSPSTESEIAGREYPFMHRPGRWTLSAEHQRQMDAGLDVEFVGTKVAAIDEAKKRAHDPLKD